MLHEDIGQRVLEKLAAIRLNLKDAPTSLGTLDLIPGARISALIRSMGGDMNDPAVSLLKRHITPRNLLGKLPAAESSARLNLLDDYLGALPNREQPWTYTQDAGRRTWKGHPDGSVLSGRVSNVADDPVRPQVDRSLPVLGGPLDTGLTNRGKSSKDKALAYAEQLRDAVDGPYVPKGGGVMHATAYRDWNQVPVDYVNELINKLEQPNSSGVMNWVRNLFFRR